MGKEKLSPVFPGPPGGVFLTIRTHTHTLPFLSTYHDTKLLWLMAGLIGCKKNKSRPWGTVQYLSKGHMPQAGFTLGLAHSAQPGFPTSSPRHY